MHLNPVIFIIPLLPERAQDCELALPVKAVQIQQFEVIRHAARVMPDNLIRVDSLYDD